MAQPRVLALTACSSIAGRQHGAIRREQAISSGLSKDSIYRLTRDGLWVISRPGVYTLWRPSGPVQVWLQRLMVAVLWLGGNAVASHRAAALLRELDGIRRAPLEVRTDGMWRRCAKKLVIHKSRPLTSDQVELVKGIPTTSVPLAPLDLAAVVRVDRLEMAVECALRRKLTTRDRILMEIDRAPRTQAGRGVLRRMVEQSVMPTGSELEVLFWQALRRRGIPFPIRQYDVLDETGRFVARPDFAYPEYKLAIECDGFGPHSSRKAFRSDRRRQNRLVRCGWTVFRFTWDDLIEDADAVAGDVDDLLLALKLAT